MNAIDRPRVNRCPEPNEVRCVINLTTANAFSLSASPTLLARADEVIE